MVTVATRIGYAEASVEEILARTGIARSTFYEHFADKSECFLAALRMLERRVLTQLHGLAADPGKGADALIESLIELAAADRPGAKLLYVESLTAGARSLAIRDELAASLTGLIEARWAQDADGGDAWDLSAARLVGGIFRLLAIRLREDDCDLGPLREGVIEWARTYAVGTEGPRWRDDRLWDPVEASPLNEPTRLDLGVPPEAGKRRHGREHARQQRTQILAALMRLSYARGYEAVTVGDVTAAAGVSRKAFYRLFPAKEEAGKEATELVFQAGMGACAAAFFSASDWPERVWRGGGALLSFLAANPEGAHLAFVESPAIGRLAVKHAYQRLEAFTLFLEQGYRQRPEDRTLSPAASEALMATMYEWAFDELRERRTVRGLLAQRPQLSYVILAPFLGPEAAGEFIEARAVAGP